MTEEKFKEIQEARNNYLSAKKELDDFRVNKHPSRDKNPYAVQTTIKLNMCDGRYTITREVTLPASIVKHLYHQELNRLMAAVHHLKHVYEKL